MRLAALLLAGTLALSGCTSDDDTPEPTVTPSSSATSDAPTPSPGASQDDVNTAIGTAIMAEDSSALRDALRQAGEADGKLAASGPRALTADADPRRNYRIAGWWQDQYAGDADFSRLFDDGALRSYAEISMDSALLQDLSSLAFRIQDDWEDQTGKKLSFNDTYDVAFDEAAGR